MERSPGRSARPQTSAKSSSRPTTRPARPARATSSSNSHGEHERAPRGDGEAAVREDLEVADDEPLVGEAVVVHAVTLRRAGVAAVISW